MATNNQENFSLESYQDELSANMQNMYNLMQQSKSGQQVIAASAKLEEKGLMSELMMLLNHESVPLEERESNIKYLADCMKISPEGGMDLFAESLYEAAKKATTDDRAKYYMLICEKAADLADSSEYKDYVEANQKFQDDQDQRAIDARGAINALENKMETWQEKEKNRRAAEGKEEGQSGPSV